MFDAATGALEGEAAGDPVVLEATVGGLRFRMTFPADGHPTAAPLP